MFKVKDKALSVSVNLNANVMNYSLEKISTVAGCDTLLALAQKKKQGLERQRRNLGESIGNFGERVDQLGSELASVQSLLKAFTTLYDSLPEGSMDRLSINVEVKRLEVREAQLLKMAFTYNVRSLLTKQVSYNRLHGQVQVVDNYITAVLNRRIALNNATLHINHTEHELLESRPANQRKSQLKVGRQSVQNGVFGASRLYTKNSELKKACTAPKFRLSSPAVVHQKQQLEKKPYGSHMPLIAFHSGQATMNKYRSTIKNLQARAPAS